MVKYNKKGAVELSINLIIMLVIGLTVLGLIIGFVTGFLGDASKSFSGKIGEDDQNKLNQIKNEAGNFLLSPATLKIKKGDKESAKLYMKIRNPTNDQFNFIPNVGLIDSSGDLNVELSAGRGGDASIPPEIYGPPITLEGGTEEAYPLEVFANKDVTIGTYYAKFVVEFGDTSYTQIVTLNVE